MPVHLWLVDFLALTSLRHATKLGDSFFVRRIARDLRHYEVVFVLVSELSVRLLKSIFLVHHAAIYWRFASLHRQHLRYLVLHLHDGLHH